MTEREMHCGRQGSPIYHRMGSLAASGESHFFPSPHGEVSVLRNMRKSCFVSSILDFQVHRGKVGQWYWWEAGLPSAL